MSTPRDDIPDRTYQTEGEQIRSADLPAGEVPDRTHQTEGEQIRSANLPGGVPDPVLEAEAATTDAHKIRADDLPEPELDEPLDVATDGEKIRPDGVDDRY